MKVDARYQLVRTATFAKKMVQWQTFTVQREEHLKMSCDVAHAIKTMNKKTHCLKPRRLHFNLIYIIMPIKKERSN